MLLSSFITTSGTSPGMIYFDHNATSPIDPEALAAIGAAFAQRLGHPQSLHRAGRAASARQEELLSDILRALGEPVGPWETTDVRWFPSGTDANRGALKALARAADKSTRRVIATRAEHPSLIRAIQELAHDGFEVAWARIDGSGGIDLNHLEELLRQPATCVAVQWVNHETGRIQPMAAVSRLCAEREVPLHVDGVQGAGKIADPDFRCQSFVFSAHKFAGPRGVAGWLVDHRLLQDDSRFEERPVAPIELLAGVATALRRSLDAAVQTRLTKWRDRLQSELLQAYPQAVVHAESAPRVGQTLSMAFPPLERQSLLIALDLEGLCCSAGAACASGSAEPSPTLVAMGLPQELVRSTIRLSLGLTTTEQEVEEGLDVLRRVLCRLAKT